MKKQKRKLLAHSSNNTSVVNRHKTPPFFKSHPLQKKENSFFSKTSQNPFFKTNQDSSAPPLQQPMVQMKDKIIQLYPKKNEDNEEYSDSDYPKLILIKLKKYGEYQIKGTNIVLYYEPGEGYYLDEGLTQKADMSEYIGETRPGIANLGGKSYDFYEEKVTSGYLTIEAALEMLERFGQQKESNRKIDTSKVAAIREEFNQRRPVHPIEVTRGDAGYELFQGRHRIYASWKAGFTMIPFNIK